MIVLMITLSILSCNNKRISKSEHMIKSLKTLEGEFVEDDSTKTIYFSKSEELEKILSEYPDKNELISKLIENMDNMEKSNSKFKNENVGIGNLCYQAIQQTIYYEHYEETDDSIKWIGNINVISDSLNLSKAKKEWKHVFENNLYINQ